MTSHPAQRHDAAQRWSLAEVSVAAVAFALAVTAITVRAAARAARPPSTLALVAAAVFFTLVAGGYIALSIGGVRRALGSMVADAPMITRLLAGPALLLVATVGYAWASGLPVPPRLAVYAVYLLIPPLLLAAPEPEPEQGGRARVPARELLVLLALWLPIELRLIPALPLPAPSGFDIGKLVGLVDAMYLFLVARPLAGIGYTYRLGARDVATAVVAFLVFAVIALPIGLSTEFLAWNPRLNATRTLGAPLIIYLVTAVPEEFLFRGLLQNLLTQWLGIRAALPVAAVIFGFAHLPDLRYVLLAAIAGVAYGWVYYRTEKITASAVTHALVDGVWGALLRAASR